MTPREIVKVYQYMMSGDAKNISLGIEICLQSDNEYLKSLPYFVRDKLFGLMNFYASKAIELEDEIKYHELYAGSYLEGQTWGKSYNDIDVPELYKKSDFYREKQKEMGHKFNTYLPVFAEKILADMDLKLIING